MDQNRDRNGAEIVRIANLYDAPDFVKKAADSDIRTVSGSTGGVYGEPSRRLYPLHTKAATWTSYGFFLENEKRGEHVKDAKQIESNIRRAGMVHGIEKKLNSLKLAFAAKQQQTDHNLPDEDFAIVWHDEDGSTERHMRISNAAEIKTAAQWFYNNRDFFLRHPYAVRRDVADRLMQKAASVGSTLGDYRSFVERTAGYGACESGDVVNAIQARVAASRKGTGANTEKQDEMLKLASFLEEKPAAVMVHEVRHMLAEKLDEFDKTARLKGEIREGKLSRVEDLLFGMTRDKLASALDEHASTLTGNIYRVEDLARLKLAKVRDYLGDDIASAMSADGIHVSAVKAASVLKTLVRSDAKLLDLLMDEIGAAPVAKEASATSFKIEDSFLKEIATRR